MQLNGQFLTPAHIPLAKVSSLLSAKGLVGPISGLEVMMTEGICPWCEPNDDFSVDQLVV